MDLNGVTIHKAYLSAAEQRAMASEIAEVAEAAPFFHPITPWGKPMRVRMTSAGKYGWFTDRKGYRYIDRHPGGTPWPPIPTSVLAVWRDLVSSARLPDCCLVNHYDAKARMGLHQDKDEVDFTWPVLSISLGDTAVFRVGGQDRSDPTRSLQLESGDVALMGGEARLAFHGIDRVLGGSSSVVSGGGRINLTLRVVD